ncbi:uncharacterized protein LOC110118702 [Ceratitis capitata]|uniref:(Mediterranean fruit fly) hypothetical protein n=1 Tax=Ceratitis capitata TaxID=7213 RepID=A0A811VBQ5_CERCA|nr:uncharacterized protein LOC110118702 [Ceratitis capitata]CAD7012816.1 unnamed protein product [Ceratitis capitata]
MTNIACTDMNNSIATVEVCRLKAVKRDVVEATVKFRLLQKLERFNLHVKLLRKYNTYEPFIINGTVDVCAFFRNKGKSPLRVLYKLIEKFTNTNHSCPFEHEIFINRFRPEHENLIINLPTGEYLILFGFYVPKNLLGYLRVWFTFREV